MQVTLPKFIKILGHFDQFLLTWEKSAAEFHSEQNKTEVSNYLMQKEMLSFFSITFTYVHDILQTNIQNVLDLRLGP